MGKKQQQQQAEPPKQWRPRQTSSRGDASSSAGGSTSGQSTSRRPQAKGQAKGKAQAKAKKAWPEPEPSARKSAASASQMNGSYIPPGCDADADEDVVRCYEASLSRGFWCPPRLTGRNESLIEAVNDWHFAMLNDSHRNQFYWDAMADKVKGKRVVDIGAGSGLLSLMAARQGAAKVLAIEASREMVDLAQLNVKRNGESEKISVIHNLSSNVTLPEAEKVDVIVSETLGALMLGEGMLDYLADACRRLGRPGVSVIPARGAQYAMLVASPTLAMVSSVQPQCCHGFDLSAIGSLQDTGNLFFTKQWGFRLNSLPDMVNMSSRVRILDVQFGIDQRKDIPPSRTFRLEALHDGVIHAVVASWEVWSGLEQEDGTKANIITTHPEDTKDAPWGFARDMQWGQGLQLIEDFDEAGKCDRSTAPKPFTVKAGEVVLLTVRYSNPCRQTFQFTLRHESKPANGA
eukprot:TRINITY_DN48717_c0_g1_i1.p1 TRINITY_DN48717_c0_g1~~TRINITY_DN48717_c0_g1_i1.p1  ORF type:complete len:461 (-),score=83.44 TRINITY_DN48717_c0_g1_i1:35-1417(-)